jgi:hypothetical protein
VGLVVVAIAPHMIHCAAISFLESIAEGANGVAVYRRMLELRMVIGISMAVVGEVAACGFNSFVETAALGILPVIPGPIPIAVLILRLHCRGQRLSFIRLGLDGAWGGDAEGKQGRGNPFNVHKNIYLRVTQLEMKNGACGVARKKVAHGKYLRGSTWELLLFQSIGRQ